MSHNLIPVLLLTIFSASGVLGGNLTCYQCRRTTDTECSPSDLLPCPSSSDRCVTHITNSADKGFSIKRECGLAPCTFDDLFVSKGLGMMGCDRSKKEYFCVFCCRENGCNQGNNSTIKLPSKLILIISIVLICLLNVTKVFIPPYYSYEFKEK